MEKKRREWLNADVARSGVSGHSIKRLIDPVLAEACGITGSRFDEDDTLYEMPQMSRESLFDILRVVDPENALALICGKGITSKRESLEFLETKGLGALILDHDAVVDEAISRKADLSLLLDLVKDRKVCHWRYNIGCSVVDLSALYGTSLRDTDIDFILIDSGNTWSFIQSVGITNIKRFGEPLLPLEGMFTPQQIKSIIARADRAMDNPVSESSLRLTKVERIDLLVRVAKAIGLEDALALRSPGVFSAMKYILKHDPDADACRFMDEMVHLSCRTTGVPSVLTKKDWGYRMAILFHMHGFSAEDAVNYMEQGFDVVQATEMRREGVPTAITSGWL